MPHRRRILIVDDSLIVRRRLTDALGEYDDIEVAGEAADVDEGLELLQSLRPEGLVLDLRLARGTGLPILEQAKRMQPAPRVVILSNHAGDDEYREQCAVMGADVLLDKSRDFGRVVEALRGGVQSGASAMGDARSIADHVRDVVFQADAQGRWTFLNAAWLDLTGVTPDNALGRTAMDFVHPDDRTENARRLGDLLGRRKDTCRHEMRYCHVDGHTTWVEANARLEIDDAGIVRGVVGTLRDISERRAAEQAVRESETRYRAVAEATSDAIVVSENRVIREVNRGFGEIFGLPPEQAIGRSILEFIAPACRGRVEAQLAENAAVGYEAKAVRADGSELDLVVMPRIIEAGGRTLRIAALRDVTRQRSLEREHLHAQRAEAMGLLAAGVAHDFKNIIAGIALGAELLADDLPVGHPARETVTDIQAVVARGRDLTDRLLAFARRDPVANKAIDVSALVRGLERVVRLMLNRGCEAVLHLQADLPSVCGDPGALEHALLNLAANARDAMPDGGVLTIETALVVVELSSARPRLPAGRYVRLSVADSGVGMSQEVQARLFERHFTTKEPGKGSGIGLASVGTTVQQFGGVIEVLSIPGAGTRFDLFFPAPMQAE